MPKILLQLIVTKLNTKTLKKVHLLNPKTKRESLQNPIITPTVSLQNLIERTQKG